ncbi:MAG: 4Fe-4S binding protein [Sulfurovum sp.]|nr:4Fe-4S binding protein [Sulfurovum sp.]
MVKMFIESLKNLTQKPATIGYPHTPSPSPKDYRGTIYYQEDLCIFCDLCEDVCPPGAILFEITNAAENIREYSYNPYLCIYCHACVDVCPKADEGCLVQAETRLAPLGRDSTLPQDVKLGYFMAKVTEAKNLDRKWDAFEARAAQSRDEMAEFKAEKKRLKQAAMKAKKEADAKTKAEAEAKEEVQAEITIENNVETKTETKKEPTKIASAMPQLLTEPKDGKKDDLTQIKGIAEKIELILNEKGIYHFQQIALWTEENIKWADENISFVGRVKREKWIEQAKELLAKK